MKAKRLCLILGAALCIGGCGTEIVTSVPKTEANVKTDVSKEENRKEENKKEETKTVKIKASPDKYTWYIKDYVGKNLASFGYTSLGGDRMDHYGSGYIELIFVNSEGSYISIEGDEELKQYKVVKQSLEPNTEMKFTFDKDENGEEYEHLIAFQTIDHIVLAVAKVGENPATDIPLTSIQVAPDKYTWYIKDYVGRNLKSCGYLSLGGDLRDHYGNATIKFVINTEDGSYIDVKDEENLKKYKITGQNIAPNTELKLEFSKDANGQEYDNLVENQNIQEIELYVSPIE